MTFRCKVGTREVFRYRTTKSGVKQRFGGCMRGNRFVKIKEVKMVKKGKSKVKRL